MTSSNRRAQYLWGVVLVGLLGAALWVTLDAMAVLEPTRQVSEADKHAATLAMYADYKAGNFPSVHDITPRELMDLQARFSDTGHAGRLVVVDIREPDEQAVSMLPGAMTQAAFLQQPALHTGTTIVAYCTISHRSGLFSRKMAARGIGVLNLKGGLLNWVHHNGTLHDGQGQPTNRLHVYGSRWDLGPDHVETVY